MSDLEKAKLSSGYTALSKLTPYPNWREKSIDKKNTHQEATVARLANESNLLLELKLLSN